MQGMKILALGSAWILLALPVAWSQDESSNETPTEEAEDPANDAADDAETDVVNEVLETDDESYRDIDDEDFTPSEEIPADQSIAFPTDI